MGNRLSLRTIETLEIDVLHAIQHADGLRKRVEKGAELGWAPRAEQLDQLRIISPARGFDDRLPLGHPASISPPSIESG